jgi:hypothetical protein
LRREIRRVLLYYSLLEERKIRGSFLFITPSLEGRDKGRVFVATRK